VIGCDLSLEMMGVAMEKKPGDGVAFVQSDAESLPFRDDALDCVVSMRFLFHADPSTRGRILREMRRVSRRWLILDYRHRYSTRYVVWRLKRALGWSDEPLERVTRAGMEHELRDAGIAVRKVLPVARIFSDKWVVIGETNAEPPAAADLP
jgi:SAM-dependent methyltransferase